MTANTRPAPLLFSITFYGPVMGAFILFYPTCPMVALRTLTSSLSSFYLTVLDSYTPFVFAPLVQTR